ncbi:MAG: carbohydrate ABC transporter permease [Paenibacillaceae bacterium]|nr:carbohydrate ABC transporter permease [Paenibacillaceae bacterium]
MKRATAFSRLFDGLNMTVLAVLGILTIIPFIWIVAGSFTASEELLRKQIVFFPEQWSLDGYRYVFSASTILRSLLVTIGVTVCGTLLNLLFTVTTAYPLARRDLDGRRPVMFLIVFTMLFSGGMIPTFLIVKAFGLINNPLSLVVPGLISAFNLVVIKNFFQQLPEGLEEAAKIDGCHDIMVLFRIVLPLSLPALATFSLFYAVGHWNSYFQAVLYINDSHWWPIQVWLRQIVILSQGSGIGDSSQLDAEFAIPPAPVLKMTVIVISTVPILLVYPFLQKHFAKGVLLGSVKG